MLGNLGLSTPGDSDSPAGETQHQTSKCGNVEKLRWLNEKAAEDVFGLIQPENKTEKKKPTKR